MATVHFQSPIWVMCTCMPYTMVYSHVSLTFSCVLFLIIILHCTFIAHVSTSTALCKTQPCFASTFASFVCTKFICHFLNWDEINIILLHKLQIFSPRNTICNVFILCEDSGKGKIKKITSVQQHEDFALSSHYRKQEQYFVSLFKVPNIFNETWQCPANHVAFSN